MPGNAILVPGTILAGPATHFDRLSLVQVRPEAFIGPEYSKSGTDADLRPTMPNRLGPSPLPAPLSTLWQMAQRWNTVLPWAASPSWADAEIEKVPHASKVAAATTA